MAMKCLGTGSQVVTPRRRMGWEPGLRDGWMRRWGNPILAGMETSIYTFPYRY